MSDFSKYLPLSQRRSGDESSVTSDWSRQLSSTLLALARVLENLPSEAWDAPTLRTQYSVRDAAGHLLWRLGTPRAARARDVLRGVLATQRPTAAVIWGLSRDAAAGSAETAVRGIRSLAGPAAEPAASSVAASRHRRGIGDLSVAVVDGFDIARSLGVALPVDSVASGAVALARALSAPAPVRAVLRGRSLAASDADWVIGRGPAFTGTAADIVLFLWERAGVPQAGTATDSAPSYPPTPGG